MHTPDSRPGYISDHEEVRVDPNPNLSRRGLLKAGALSATSLAAMACAGPSASAPSSPAVSSAASSAPAASPLASASSAVVTGKVLDWNNLTDESEFAGLAAVEAVYKAKYPGVELTLENVPNEEYMAKATAAVQAGTLPDSGPSDPSRMGDLVALKAVNDITAQVKAMPTYGSFAPVTFVPATLDGKIYGVPSYVFIDWYYYRTDYFADAGIATFPTTWPDFLSAAQKLTDASKNRYGFGLRGGDGGADDIVLVIESFGTDIVDPDGKPALDKAILIEALTFETELFTKYKVTPPSTPSDGFKGITDGFKTGQTAIFKHHTGSLQSMIDALGVDKFSTAVAPGKTRVAAWLSPNYVSSYQPVPSEAAWSWLQFWSQPDTQITFLEKTGYFPSNLDAASDPRLAGKIVYDAAFKTIEVGRPGPVWAGYPGWSVDVLLTQFQACLTGSTTPTKAADVILAGLDKAVS
jgi:multiple sugar transport system substrate-binding protein